MRRSVETMPRAILHPKVVVGWTLSFAPKPLLQSVNRLGHRIRRSQGNVAFRDGYT
jgi:hypothetical protein